VQQHHLVVVPDPGVTDPRADDVDARDDAVRQGLSAPA